MASDARLLLPARLPSLLLRPMLRAPCATASTSPRCGRILTVARPCTCTPAAPGRGWSRLRPRAAEAEPQGRVQRGDDVVDSNVLPYCSIDGKVKKSIGEMEQEFLQALQSFYYDKTAIMSNEEFDNLKEELMWEGSSVVMLSPDEQRLLEASMAYVSGNPIMTDAEFDDLKLRLKKEGSGIVQEGPRCSLRSRKPFFSPWQNPWPHAGGSEKYPGRRTGGRHASVGGGRIRGGRPPGVESRRCCSRGVALSSPSSLLATSSPPLQPWGGMCRSFPCRAFCHLAGGREPAATEIEVTTPSMVLVVAEGEGAGPTMVKRREAEEGSLNHDHGRRAWTCREIGPAIAHVL